MKLRNINKNKEETRCSQVSWWIWDNLMQMASLERGRLKLTFDLCSVAQASRLFAIPWTTALQALHSMGFPRQEYWSGSPYPPPGDLRQYVKFLKLWTFGRLTQGSKGVRSVDVWSKRKNETKVLKNRKEDSKPLFPSFWILTAYLLFLHECLHY